jgi:hypothetical protein
MMHSAGYELLHGTPALGSSTRLRLKMSITDKECKKVKIIEIVDVGLSHLYSYGIWKLEIGGDLLIRGEFPYKCGTSLLLHRDADRNVKS